MLTIAILFKNLGLKQLTMNEVLIVYNFYNLIRVSCLFLLLYFQLCNINGGPWKGSFGDLTMALKNHQQYGGNNASFQPSSQPILNKNAKKTFTIKKEIK